MPSHRPGLPDAGGSAPSVVYVVVVPGTKPERVTRFGSSLGPDTCHRAFAGDFRDGESRMDVSNV